MLKIQESSTITVYGANWAFVQTALGGDREGQEAPGFANVYSNLGQWQDLAREALQAAGLDPDLAQDAVFASTRPGFGAAREWELTDGATVARVDDQIGGEWLLLLPTNVVWAKWLSGTSDSCIAIEQDGHGTWTVAGEFPITDGERYEGTYFGCLQDAINNAAGNAEVEAAAAAALKARRDEFGELVGAVYDQLAVLESFQDWYNEDGAFTVATAEEVASATRIISGAGWATANTLRDDVAEWSGRRDPVLVLEAVPPAGWDAGHIAQLDDLATGWKGAGRNPAAGRERLHLAVLPLPGSA